FETDPEFQQELEWVEEFVRTEVEPVDQVIEPARPTGRAGADAGACGRHVGVIRTRITRPGRGSATLFDHVTP
ncbi:hypothetical protein ABZ590_20375, partial [Streptomyces hirsutus]|uniref:hypothetical protein n=1 Tax=Streptomyces hirsutus TaxID=35620 RepID=UPI0033E2FB2D